MVPMVAAMKRSLKLQALYALRIDETKGVWT